MHARLWDCARARAPWRMQLYDPDSPGAWCSQKLPTTALVTSVAPSAGDLEYALNERVEAPRRRSLRSLGSEREPTTLSYGGPPLSPTSRQHAYKSAVLALGLTSCPPNPQSGAQHGAIIPIPTTVRRAMRFGGRARALMHARPAGHYPTLASWALRVCAYRMPAAAPRSAASRMRARARAHAPGAGQALRRVGRAATKLAARTQ